MTAPNAQMTAAWNGADGDSYARDWQYYDGAVASYHRALLERAGIVAGENVLDFGCGTGQVARDASTAGAADVLGIDISQQLVDKSRELAAGLPTARFEHGDVQTAALPSQHFDVALSRFGAMFFDDPVAAFGNIATALRPNGRLVLVAWTGVDDNEWQREIRGALDVGRDLPAPAAGAPGPFGLANADQNTTVLDKAGYADIAHDHLQLPYRCGTDTAEAFGFFQRTGMFRGLTETLSEDDSQRALAALEATMRAHETPNGVIFESGAWLITAHRAT
jgi:SAM-dependent methyltransferase